MSVEDDLIPTRQSLLSRLKDWEDWASCQDFFHTYWKLIYKAARRAGLNTNEAEEVVQDTLISVSKARRAFVYDPRKGSFKGWLHTTTIWRIRDHLRRKQRQPAMPWLDSAAPPERSSVLSPVENAIDTNWESDWEEHLAEAALDRVKKMAAPKHFQIFDMAFVKHWSTARIAKTMRMRAAYVYFVKHRVAARVRWEIRKLRRDPAETIVFPAKISAC